MTQPPETPARPARDTRRELTAAVLLSAVAGALALSSGGQPWADVTVTRQPPLPPYADVLTGGELAPLVPATGLLLLAGAVALFAVRGWGRVAVGLLTAVAGGVLVVSGVRALTGSVDVGTGDLGGSVIGLGGATVDVATSAAWPVLAALGGVLGCVAGVLVVLRGRSWPGLGRRYERTPGAAEPARRQPSRPESAEDRHQAAWKALDNGTDPTDDPRDDATREPGR
ncbi:Trp biosynthesis-associated membrane protein [Modestobacter sp. Leaf380]|uniref:Trp biosynthesis-associated membrane protein n=1 Tax=Modestobacter sp. Leaf380 TaxID=1736356 RepID=UPI0006F57F34|nr:Trp biosynthesis-associated membrane protein [Modestobacter sp. Leaf380]KQS64893.1 Trp biosynthesis protein [Modestobacter sp. Leaf380]